MIPCTPPNSTSTGSPQSRRMLFSVLALCALFTTQLCAAQTDLPGRVANVNYLNGPVTFSTGVSNVWQYATLSQPLTSGDHLWVDHNGVAELHIGSTAIQLASQSSLDLIDVTDTSIRLNLVQGTLHAHIRDFPQDQSIEIDTPDFIFTPQQPGDYTITANPSAQNSNVIVREGNGLASSNRNPNMTVTSGQQVTVWGASAVDASFMAAPAYNQFDQWVSQRTAQEEQSISAQYVSRETAGYQALDNNGDWRNDPQYGAVWIPRLTVANWAPYHDGHWAFIDPWGWTWIDDMPWGFATFHYGRWAFINQQWCWVPGSRHLRPYYAPALVGFVGGIDINVALSNGSGNIGWFPLAPGEMYRPPYNASPAYLHNINSGIRAASAPTTILMNQRISGAVTTAPRATFSAIQAHAPSRQSMAPGMSPPAINRGGNTIIPTNQRRNEALNSHLPERSIPTPGNVAIPTGQSPRAPINTINREALPEPQQGQSHVQPQQMQQAQPQGNTGERVKNTIRNEAIPTPTATTKPNRNHKDDDLARPEREPERNNR